MINTNDETAIHILKTIAQVRLQPESGDLPPTPAVRDILAAAFGDPMAISATKGELARAALDLLAQDPAFAEEIRGMAGQPGVSGASQKYFDAAGIALTTAVLLVLQTRFKFKVSQKREWSIEIDKKSAGDALIKGLVQRLLSLLDRLEGR